MGGEESVGGSVQHQEGGYFLFAFNVQDGEFHTRTNGKMFLECHIFFGIVRNVDPMGFGILHHVCIGLIRRDKDQGKGKSLVAAGGGGGCCCRR